MGYIGSNFFYYLLFYGDEVGSNSKIDYNITLIACFLCEWMNVNECRCAAIHQPLTMMECRLVFLSLLIVTGFANQDISIITDNRDIC